MVCSDNTQTFAAQPLNSIMALINRTQYWLGLKEPMEQGLLQANAEFLKENYPNFTPQRFSKAFSLALVGKLNVDANHYGAWTPRYAAHILNAYNAMEQKVITKVRYKASLESPPDDTPLNQLVARAFRVLFDDKKSYADEEEAFWADEIVRWKLRNAYALMQRYEANCNNYGATNNEEATETNINKLFSRLSLIYAELTIWDLADSLEVQCPSIFINNLNERATI